MQEYLKRTWAQVDLDCIARNYHHLKERLAPDCRFMAVVKADAYGHGDGYVARRLAQEGADWFGVSNLAEALSLRRHGITQPILILGFTPPTEVTKLSELALTQTVYSFDYAALLSKAACEAEVRVGCHIKVDTGMTRIGFYAQEGQTQRAAQEIDAVCRLPGLSCTGIFTHFSCADELSENSCAYTHGQFDAFRETLDALSAMGRTFSIRHCCNSAGTLRFPEMHLDMVRVGVALYGLAPSPECAGICALEPAMVLSSIVTQVKACGEDIAVSYGRRYHTCEGGRRLATVAVGYADGLRRLLSNRGQVLLHGCCAPIVGSICMDQMLVDVTDIPEVRMGDYATLVGVDGACAISFDDWAKLNGTINYEEACLIGRRVPRVYLEGEKEIGLADYIT